MNVAERLTESLAAEIAAIFSGRKVHDAVVRNLQRACELAIDAACREVSRRGLGGLAIRRGPRR